jgi:hypothetical protein
VPGRLASPTIKGTLTVGNLCLLPAPLGQDDVLKTAAYHAPDPNLGGKAPQHTNGTTNGSSGKKYAYTTLITRGSYLAGVIILAHTLRKHGSQY